MKLLNRVKETVNEMYKPTQDKGASVLGAVYSKDIKKVSTPLAVAVGALDGCIKGFVGPVGGAVLGAITAYRDVKQTELIVKSVVKVSGMDEDQIESLINDMLAD